MIYDETFDYLWHQLANPLDLQATRRLKDYQKKRLKRAQLAAALRSYFLEAQWTVTTGAVNQIYVGSTKPTTQPLLMLDGSIRTTADNSGGAATDNNNFDIQLIRSGGDSRVQPSTSFVRDEHLLTPAQCPILPIKTSLGQGTPWPETWLVPLSLAPNELLQLTAKVLVGGVPAEETTFAQFRTVAVNGRNEDEKLTAELRDWITANDLQRPVYLAMTSEGARSIVYPDGTATARTTAKTVETEAPLLVIGYSVLFNRGGNDGGVPPIPITFPSSNPKWRLESSDGWAFSKEEIDISTFAFAGPSYFWQQMPFPFLLPKGSSLAASFSRRNAVNSADEAAVIENQDNYVIFRCVTV